MHKNKTLILNGKTIKKLVGMKDAIEAVEKAFYALGEGKTKMPAKLYLNLPEYNGDFRAMPAYIEGFKGCSMKWVNVHPDNKKKGLPTVMAIIILSDPDNGFPLCIMDAGYATALRTGAAGGIAAKYLARCDSQDIALVGCGAQAKTQLLALDKFFNIKKVKVWGFKTSEAETFIKKMDKNFKMAVCGTVKECVYGCDIVVTTTPSREPIVKLEWLKEGVHINAIGADSKGKEELDPGILKKARIIVDCWEQASHSGEINVPLSSGIISKENIFADIGEIVTGKKRSRTRDKEITVFDSTGLAIQDTAIANVIYEKALREKKGRYIELI
ncbi:MAG: alanine dehydrogenase [bacterium]